MHCRHGRAEKKNKRKQNSNDIYTEGKQWSSSPPETRISVHGEKQTDLSRTSVWNIHYDVETNETINKTKSAKPLSVSYTATVWGREALNIQH